MSTRSIRVANCSLDLTHYPSDFLTPSSCSKKDSTLVRSCIDKALNSITRVKHSIYSQHSPTSRSKISRVEDRLKELRKKKLNSCNLGKEEFTLNRRVSFMRQRDLQKMNRSTVQVLIEDYQSTRQRGKHNSIHMIPRYTKYISKTRVRLRKLG